MKTRKLIGAQAHCSDCDATTPLGRKLAGGWSQTWCRFEDRMMFWCPDHLPWRNSAGDYESPPKPAQQPAAPSRRAKAPRASTREPEATAGLFEGDEP